MTLQDQDIAEFQRLYRKHFGTEIDHEEAKEKGLRLLLLFKALLQAEAKAPPGQYPCAPDSP